MAEQALSADEMYGIAKKVNHDLEKFPMHTHSAIVEMIRVGMQHRNLAMQAAQNAEQAEMQKRALAVQEQQMELARMAAQRQSIDRIHIERTANDPGLITGLKPGPAAVQISDENAKAPEEKPVLEAAG